MSTTASTKGVLKSQVAGGSSQSIEDGRASYILQYIPLLGSLDLCSPLPNISLFFKKPLMLVVLKNYQVYITTTQWHLYILFG